MAYPKPLSQKSIERRYHEAGMSDEVRRFLHDLFAACANLYGGIPLRDVWEIYKYLEITSPKIRRKDLVTFSAIVRREQQPYYIYEIEELYLDEPHQDLERHIVSRELVTTGYYRFVRFHQVMQMAVDKPYYVPEDMLAWKEPVPLKEETALLTFLGELVSTADEVTPQYGDPYPNENKGKKLKDFSFLTSHEQIEIDLMKRPEEKEKFLKEISGNAAEKLMRSFKLNAHLGIHNPAENLKHLTEGLDEAGVQMDENQFSQLIQLTMDFHNNSHLWCNAGWTPADLFRAMYHAGQKPLISFGPGYQQAFAEGTLDRDEMIRELHKHGFDVAE